MIDAEEAARVDWARNAYLQGVFFGNDSALNEAISALAVGERKGALTPSLLLEYGKLLHARSLACGVEEPEERPVFGRALAGLREAGDVRGEAEVLFWQGLCSQLFDEDIDAAEPLFERSYKLADEIDDELTMSYVARHLGFIALARGRLDDGRRLLQESLERRRRLSDFPAGEAAAVLALGELELEAGNTLRGEALLEEADAIASRIGAKRVQEWIAAARVRCRA